MSDKQLFDKLEETLDATRESQIDNSFVSEYQHFFKPDWKKARQIQSESLPIRKGVVYTRAIEETIGLTSEGRAEYYRLVKLFKNRD